jgi:hypothetical protein
LVMSSGSGQSDPLSGEAMGCVRLSAPKPQSCMQLVLSRTNSRLAIVVACEDEAACHVEHLELLLLSSATERGSLFLFPALGDNSVADVRGPHRKSCLSDIGRGILRPYLARRSRSKRSNCQRAP